MQISIDQSEGLERIVNVALEADDIQPQVDKKLVELGKEVRLKGFRQGRVPKNILQQRFGQHARQEVLGQLMQDSIEKAIKDNELEIIAAPEVTKADDTDNGGFEFQAKVELMPEVPAIELDQLKVEKIKAEVTDKDIDGMIKNLQKQKQDWKESKGKIANKDLVTIEYSAKGKEVTYPNEGTEKMGILLGESKIPDALKDAVVGLKAKESAELELEFPEDFNVADLAGKKAKMSFEVTDVRKAKLPKVDEEFIKSFGIESGEEEDFRNDIRKNLERELTQTVNNSFKTNALKELRDACKDTLLPESMVTKESQHMAQQEQQRAKQMGQEDAPLRDAADFVDAAKDRILNTLIIQDIAKKEDIKTDFAKVREQINEIAQTFEQPQEVVQMYYQNQELMASIEQSVIESQVMEWVESKVQLKEKKKSFDDLMKPAA
ncbi:trigger factor [Marinicella sp. S1101]|uniref:trigger factor n=1 Tax=Marinicella marina TaxID=2996016 RepID=UPI002260CB81|nr:trigger factor [Marinicella marina]MCX7554724.1 trigger factor [Marinicella marina]MDJ1141460.1 trigger factor [Marinicella marina]